MTDFLDRFGAELAGAERRLVRDADQHEGRHRPWPRRRAGLLLLAVLAVTVPAVATQPWNPILGDPARDDVPAGTSLTLPPPSQLKELAVLRRPQNEADRGPDAQRLFRTVGAEYKGVRLGSVRLLTSASGYQALLVPSEAHGRSSEPGRFEVEDDLCVQALEGSFCSPIKGLAFGNFMGILNGGPLIGLVPDGVATVVVHFADGRALRARVNENFFSLDVAPPDILGPWTFKVAWLDASGRQVGPRGRLASKTP